MSWMITITNVNGEQVTLPYGDENRCDNCGKEYSKRKDFCYGGMLNEPEWACCGECYDEMIEKGCCFEELGDGVYRPQKY